MGNTYQLNSAMPSGWENEPAINQDTANLLYDYYSKGVMSIPNSPGNTSTPNDWQAYQNYLSQQGNKRWSEIDSNYNNYLADAAKNRSFTDKLTAAGKAADTRTNAEAINQGYTLNDKGIYVDASGNPISGSAAQGIEAKVNNWANIGMGGYSGGNNDVSPWRAKIGKANEKFLGSLSDIGTRDLYGSDYQARMAEDIMGGFSKDAILENNPQDYGYANYVTRYYDAMKNEYNNKNPQWSKIDYEHQNAAAPTAPQVTVPAPQVPVPEYNSEGTQIDQNRYDTRYFAEQKAGSDMATEAAFQRWYEQDLASGMSPKEIEQAARKENSYEGRQYANWVMQQRMLG